MSVGPRIMAAFQLFWVAIDLPRIAVVEVVENSAFIDGARVRIAGAGALAQSRQ